MSVSLLERVTKNQSYEFGKRNEYNGLDSWSIGKINDNKIYALVHDGNLADLESGNISRIEFFFDQAIFIVIYTGIP